MAKQKKLQSMEELQQRSTEAQLAAEERIAKARKAKEKKQAEAPAPTVDSTHPEAEKVTVLLESLKTEDTQRGRKKIRAELRRLGYFISKQ